MEMEYLKLTVLVMKHFEYIIKNDDVPLVGTEDGKRL